MPHNDALYFKRSSSLPVVELRRANHSAACYDTHTHDEFSFGVIDAGEACYTNHGTPQRIHQGMTVLINPGTAHACNPDRGQRWSYRMLFVETAWMARLQQETGQAGAQDYMPFSRTSLTSRTALADFNALYAALLEEGNPLAAESQLIHFLMTHGFTQMGDSPVLQLAPNLRQARELIMDQLTDNLSLDSISEVAGISRYHLIRSFKQRFGQTPHAYQLDQRINRAKHLLRNGESIVAVAQQLGFADQSHFQRHFKRRLATTPKHYQQSFVG
ncbi:AraC family transcriptional regulator [Leeia oryzae]|uniref:AraC family transcriptional regulator n=1 Tax=Leeia oryzae TaxID=356662 RepID=UPI00036461C9|nr:AraC family transcriptional regulator [Leeia oryzae]